MVQNQIDNMAVLTAEKNAKPNAASILVRLMIFCKYSKNNYCLRISEK